MPRLLVIAALWLGFAMPVWAQLTVTRTPSAALTDLGKVAAGTAATTFTVEPWSSTVNRSPSNATGHLRFQSGALTLPSVTVACTSTACVGAGKEVQIRITTNGLPTGVTVNKWSAGAFAFVGGYEATAQSGTTDVKWKVFFSSTSSKVTFNIGQAMTIAANASGTLNLGYRVTAGVGTAGTSGGVTGTMQTIMYRPISITRNNHLIFGQVKRPPSGTGHVIISPAASPARSTDGGVVLINDTSVSAAKFTTSGQTSASISISIPASVILYGSRGGQMTLVPSGSGTGSTSLSAANPGTKVSYVGGSLDIDSDDPTGTYRGDLTVTAVYN